MSLAFVSTNSICQGTQVNDLWPFILSDSVEIFFAYKDFPWTNNAKNKAAVICSIIGLKLKSNKKIIQRGTIFRRVNMKGILRISKLCFLKISS